MIAGSAAAADFWKNKAPEEWTPEQALRILQKSPWTKKRRVTLGPMTRYIPYPPNTNMSAGRRRIPTPSSRQVPQPRSLRGAVYLIRLESAAPVVAAFRRLKDLELESSANYQSPPPRLPEDRYVITVKATQTRKSSPRPFSQLSEEQLKQRARLKTQLGEVTPEEVERSGKGSSAAVHFFFPRTWEGKPLTPPEAPRLEFRIIARGIILKTKFSLIKPKQP